MNTLTDLDSQPCFAGLVRNVSPFLGFSNIFAPHCRVFGNIPAQQLLAFPRIHVDYANPVLAQPVDTTLKIPRLPHDDRANAELADESAAIPARGQSGCHDFVAIAALAAGFAKRVSLAVR